MCFFEEAGAVVLDDAVEEVRSFSSEVFVPEDGNLAASAFEGVGDVGSAEFAVGAVFGVR